MNTKRKTHNSIKYMLLLLMAVGTLLMGCNEQKEVSGEVYQVTEEDLSYALPKIGEAAIIRAKVKAGSKGTISVATVGSPNTEILQEAGQILGEMGYELQIEVCEDYVKPNQLAVEGAVDCNYYQHAAFLHRYNIENQTELIEMAKIHYEPMAIYSSKVNNIKEVEQGAKVLIPENPTALAQAMWLLHDNALITLMSDADMNTVIDDMEKNPLELEIVPMKEEEILSHLSEAELVICHTGFALKEAMDTRDSLLVTEKKESMMAQNLSQSIVVNEYPNENAEILINVLMSEKMQSFIETKYQGSIYMMDGRIGDLEVTEAVSTEIQETTDETK